MLMWLVASLMDTKCTLHMFVQSIYPLINLVFVCLVCFNYNYQLPDPKKRHISHFSNYRRPFAGDRPRYFWCSDSEPRIPKIPDVCSTPFHWIFSFECSKIKFVMSEGKLWLSVSIFFFVSIAVSVNRLIYCK